MREYVFSFLRLFLLSPSAVFLLAQTQHITAFTGTWKVNVARSKYQPGPGPRSQTLTLAPDGTVTVDGIGPQREPFHHSHPWSDGQEVPVSGMANTTIFSKYGSNTIDDTWKVGGKTVQTGHAVLAPDGKTVTLTLDTTDPQGHSGHYVIILEKQ